MEWSLGIRFGIVLLALNPQIHSAFFCHSPRLSLRNQLSTSMFSLDPCAQIEAVTKWIFAVLARKFLEGVTELA